jgi:polyphosphate kinase 2 (PPK2 family)
MTQPESTAPAPRRPRAARPRRPSSAPSGATAATRTRTCCRASSYEKQKYRLQVELLKLQAWVKDTGAAGGDPLRGARRGRQGRHHQALHGAPEPARCARGGAGEAQRVERGQWYFQRYIQHLPTRGEIVLFDRSWYNRSGVERVMGFCSDAEYDEFMRQVPEFERQLVRSGVHLFKFWFSVSRTSNAAASRSAGAPAQAVEAEPDRHGLARQVGRLHPRQGGHVPALRHLRFARGR